ncbi:MAG: PD-(D/E)XK nuclease family protein [Planctomycetota bacterium]
MQSEPHTLRLTATRRLARALLDREREPRGTRGSVACLPPSTWQVDDWLRHVWQQSWPRTLCLGGRQTEALWEAEIRRDGASDLLVELHERVSQAVGAHALLAEWRCEPPADGPDAPEESRAFLRWRAGFLRRLADNGWLDLPGVLAAALQLLATTQYGPPSGTRVQLLGFDRLTPRVEALCSALIRRGCAVERVQPVDSAPRIRRCVARDPAEEVAQAARWSRRRLELDPTARIGVIVPQLSERLALVEAAFEDELTPGAIALPDPDDAVHRHNISLSWPLSSRPIVASALAALAVAADVTVEELSTLLRSPFLFGGMAESVERSRLEREVRRRGRFRLSLSMVVELARRGAPTFVGLIERWQRHLATRPESASPSAWAAWLRAALRDLGWPGERALSSAELQTVRAFHARVDDLQSLERVSGPMDYATALGLVRRWAGEVRFQPLGRWAPVQILGVLEAGGLEFDHLWVMGLDEEAWPPRSYPHPLLPVAWQRERGLPHSCPASERGFWRGVTQRLIESAPEVVLSVAATADGHEPRLSPWVTARVRADYDLAAAPPSALWSAAIARSGPQLREVRPLECWVDLGAERHVPGGVQVIADQAQCPFRAFARHRLGAGRSADPDATLAASERGRLLHRVLELFWRQWRTQSDLLRATADERVLAVTTAVEIAAAEIIDPRDDLPAVVRRLERRRTHEIVHAWLAVEQARPAFTVVGLEVPLEVECGGLRLRGRVDRIDRLGDDASVAVDSGDAFDHVIIDYKAGPGWRAAMWLGERPDAPQLPLYAVNATVGVSAVAFAVLDRLELGLRGWARDAGRISPRGIESLTPEPWARVVRTWREGSSRLGEAFRAGDATVDPKAGSQTCSQCDFPGLCRIAERSARRPLSSPSNGETADAHGDRS